MSQTSTLPCILSCSTIFCTPNVSCRSLPLFMHINTSLLSKIQQIGSLPTCASHESGGTPGLFYQATPPSPNDPGRSLAFRQPHDFFREGGCQQPIAKPVP